MAHNSAYKPKTHKMLSLPSRVQSPTEMPSTTILRRSVASMVPLAVRAVQRNCLHSALFPALHHCSFSPKPSSRPFPSLLHCHYSCASELSTDDDLLRVIDSEIKSAEEADDLYKHAEYPDGFPFEIQDNLGKESVKKISSDLDENLQNAFHKYLETRGIKPAMIDFLHDYMTKKENREYTMWLKTVKKFVED